MKYKNPAQAALGIFIGTIAGAQFGLWAFDENSVLGIIVSAVVGGIVGWITVDPMRVWYGILHAWSRVRTRSKTAIVAAFASGVASGTFFMIIGMLVYVSDAQFQTTHYIVFCAVAFGCFGSIGALAGYSLALIESPATHSQQFYHDMAGYALKYVNPISICYWAVWGCLKLLGAVVRAVVRILPQIPSILWTAIMGIGVFLKRVVIYSLSRKTMIAFIGSVIFAPLAFLYGNVLAFAVLGAVLGALMYEVVGVRIFKLTTPQSF